ncbi:MAG TPA: cytochrome c, partial [Blastocatellia bacterium]|nr:cytochrome c [Blastocatellia bacterium]
MKRLLGFLLVVGFAGMLCQVLPVTRADSRAGSGGEAHEVTFTRDVAPILYKNCVECHRPGDIAPMSLLTYKDARPWARSIRQEVVTREMPPWHADPHYGPFANNRSLSHKDVDTIAAWVDQGAKEGRESDLPAVPSFVNGWLIGNPDVVLTMPQAYDIPANGPDEYIYFTIPTNFKQD